MVPEGNSGTHGHTQVFISRDSRVRGMSHTVMCHHNWWRSSTAWPDALHRGFYRMGGGRKTYNMYVTSTWSTTEVSPSISAVHHHNQSDTPPGAARRRGKNPKVCSYGQLLYLLKPSESRSLILCHGSEPLNTFCPFIFFSLTNFPVTLVQNSSVLTAFSWMTLDSTFGVFLVAFLGLTSYAWLSGLPLRNRSFISNLSLLCIL